MVYLLPWPDPITASMFCLSADANLLGHTFPRVLGLDSCLGAMLVDMGYRGFGI